MRDLFLLADEIQSFCQDRGWRFCFIGGIALQRWGEPRLNTCSGEDLVVLKAFADRSRDWADIEGVLLRSGHRLVWETVEAELEPLCEAKEAPHILPRLRALRASP